MNVGNNISRGGPNGQIDFVTSLPFNFANLNQRGVDIETSYITSLGSIVSSWKGDLTLRALGTHVIRSRRDDGFNPVQDFAGDNSDVGPLNWRWLFTTESQLYLNVANVLDEQPPLIASANPSLMSTNPQLYDTIGRTYFAGVRFKF